jgi:cytochrome c-type biogenesis protein CcmH
VIASVFAVVVFALVVLAAALFAAWPVAVRREGRARFLLAGAIALFVTGVGLGTYLMLGRPALAARTLEGRQTRDLNSMIAVAARHMREAPDDLKGWRLLSRAYLDAGDGANGLKAAIRAVEVARATGQAGAGIYSEYGMAVVATSHNTVPPEAENAFRLALSLDPRDRAALYFLGYAAAARGQAGDAVALWQALLDESPGNAPFHQELVDGIARLKAQQGARPNVGAMVAGLAARLKAEPDDPAGWQKLVRAYAMLEDKPKANAALKDARAAMAKNPRALAQLSAEARELGLE